MRSGSKSPDLSALFHFMFSVQSGSCLAPFDRSAGYLIWRLCESRLTDCARNCRLSAARHADKIVTEGGEGGQDRKENYKKNSEVMKK